MHLPDEDATARVGAWLAERIEPGDVITLSGDLGAGKTTLARGVLSASGLQGEAPSPSFAIVQTYAPPETRRLIAHIDLYRIQSPHEAEELGIWELRLDHVLIVEWPELLDESMWSDALRLRLDSSVPGGRRLTAQVPPSWESRWPPT